MEGRASRPSSEMGEAKSAGNDIPYYIIGLLSGAGVGYVDVRVEDLLLTAVLIACACMLLGFMRPQRAWRWVVLVPLFIPVGQVLAYKVAGQRITRMDLSETFVALIPAIAGAACGAVARNAIRRLWQEK
jgi:hypothetical protein